MGYMRQKQLVSFVTMRGVMYARQLDGIRFMGAGGRGGFDIETVLSLGS